MYYIMYGPFVLCIIYIICYIQYIIRYYLLYII